MRTPTPRLLLSLSLVAATAGAQALTFNFTFNPGATQDARNAYAEAAAFFSAEYLDPITINIDARFEDQGAGGLAFAQSNRNAYSYASVRTAIVNDAIYPQNGTDPQVIASLPTGTSVPWRRNSLIDGSTVIDNDNSGNNNFLAVNRANAKALGLLAGNDAGIDALISVNSNPNPAQFYDYSRAGGVANNRLDLVATIIHEIGHAMGFVSGVDAYDTRSFGSASESQLNGAAVFSVLDLMRFSDASGTRDVRYGASSYFSINGGVSNSGFHSTGAVRGDGNQASHWRDDEGNSANYVGIMDPVTEFGLEPFTIQDGRAFDAIGYDVVPEPATLLALGVGAAALGARRRRRKS